MDILRRALSRHLRREELAEASRQIHAIIVEPDSANRQRLGEQLAAMRPPMAPHIATFLREVDEVYSPWSPEGRRVVAAHLSKTPAIKRIPR
jgi:hypothetical protein